MFKKSQIVCYKSGAYGMSLRCTRALDNLYVNLSIISSYHEMSGKKHKKISIEAES